MAEPLLEIKDLSVAYRVAGGDNPAVKGANLTVNRGEILGIAGESGCGKSTLASSVLRLLKPPGHVQSGEVLFHPLEGDSFDLLKLDDRRLRSVRWKHLSYLPQGSMNSLNPVAKIVDQFEDVIRAHSGTRKDQIPSMVERLLDMVGLESFVAQMYPHELSGGMKQRVITAIALALDPELLIADEPTTALDVTVQRLVIQNLADLRDKFGVTLAIITHDMGVHAQLSDRVAVMYEGEIVETGDVRQVFKEPRHEYTKSLIESVPTLDVHQRAKEAAANG